MCWLADWLNHQHFSSRAVLDYGCGTGSATPFILECLNPELLIGVDISSASLEVARENFDRSDISFEPIGQPREIFFDVAFCNGVFHHIAPDERQASLQYIFQSLRPGGIFALFENNPWNPATRYVMSRCAFDHDAITLSPFEARSRMKNSGFRILTTRHLFMFPAFLKHLRFLESPLSPLPVGTQYVVVGMKP